MSFRTCPWCDLKHAQFAVLATNCKAAPADGSGEQLLTLMSCPSCAGPVVVTTGPGTFHELGVYPEDPQQGLQVDHLPGSVERHYQDAQKVLRVGAADSAAVELRRTLEAATQHFSAPGGTLVRQIGFLIEQGLVTKKFAAALHDVRQIGNVGAHASDAPIPTEVVHRALRFTTVLLRNLFEVPAELDAIARDPDGAEVEEPGSAPS